MAFLYPGPPLRGSRSDRSRGFNASPSLPTELELVDISAPGQESWHEAYKHDIPVIHLNGVEICRHRVNEREFRAHLADVK